MDPALELVLSGGPVVWLLLLFSTVALTVTLFKLWQFWWLLRLSDCPTEQALTEVEANHRPQALMLVNGSRNPRAAVLHDALVLFADPALTSEQASAESLRRARLAVAELGNYLRVLEVIANLAPLLGLFGTVLGMIEAFQAMEAAGSQVNPAVLSGGIWQALLTTAVGLAVAIPVAVAHSWFERRVEVEATAIQDDLAHTFTLLARNHADYRPQTRPRRA